MGSVVNGWTFVVLGVAGLGYFTLGTLIGNLTGSGRGPLVFGLLIAASALICEWRGMPGRVMGAPLWVWGGGLAAVGGINAYGALALAPVIGAAVLGGGVYWLQRGKKKASVWDEAGAALERARESASSADLGNTWIALEAALRLPPRPFPEALAAEVREHLHEVAVLTRKTFGGTLSPAQRERLEALQEALSQSEGALSEADGGWLQALVAGRGL